jgi:hypothetical protein
MKNCSPFFFSFPIFIQFSFVLILEKDSSHQDLNLGYDIQILML